VRARTSASSVAIPRKRGLTRGSTLHKIHLTSSITRWLKDFTEAMRREDLSPVTVRGYLSELEMFMA
jgi:hypothetical protein